MPRSFRDIIQNQQITGFVGREAQLAMFRDNLTVPPGVDRRRYLFSIHGDGGVGKSFLLSRMEQAATEQGWLTAVVDEAYAVPEAMAVIARSFEDQGGRLKQFGKRYAAYHKRTAPPGETEPARPSGAEQAASIVTQAAVRVGLGAARELPGGNLLTGAVKPDDAAQRLDDLRSDAARKWRERDDPLATAPVDDLVRRFVDNLCELDRPIALFFDTYERSAPYLDAWLRGLFDGTWGDLPADIVVTVAGRFPLDPGRWSAYLGVHMDMPLAPFTATEARQLLAQREITDEDVIERILAASGGLPLSLAMLAATRPQDPASVGDVDDSLVERFLQWEQSPEMREVALAAALPRHIDLDVLAVASGAPEPEQAYGWLTAQPFVARTAGRCQYHDIVRGPMLRLYRTRSAQRWRDQHTALATAYARWRAEMTDAEEWELWKRPDWQERVFEEIYHRLCADPRGALPEALEHAVNACRHGAPTARLAETIAQAGRDTGADDVLGVGEQLLAALAAEDGERIAYLDVILRRPETTQATRANALRERGRQHRFAQRYDQALTDVNRALAIRPEYQDAYVTRGWTYSMMGRYADAMADFDRAVELNPGDAETFARRGETYRLMVRYDEALTDLDRALGLDPDRDWILAERGETYRLMGWYDEALADFDRAVELDPEYAWAIGSRGQTYQALSRYEEALADFDRAIELDPEYAWAIAERGTTYSLMGRYDEALTDFDRAIELDPEYAYAIGGRSRTYTFVGRYDDALADLARILDRRPDTGWAIADRGETYSSMGRYDEALADFGRAIELDPGHAYAIGCRGKTYRVLRRYDDALADFDRAVELAVHREWYLAERGETYRLMGRYDEALADFDGAIELDPEYVYAIGSRGQTYRALLRNESALADLTRALELDPGLSWAVAEQAEAYRLMGRYSEALTGFHRAIELDPDDAWAIGSRGQTYRALHRYDDALADFDRALELRPDHDWVLAERARVLRRLGRYAAARAELDRAIELDPGDVSYLVERALTTDAGPAARYQCVVDLDVSFAEARSTGASITAWLASEGIVGPESPDTRPVPGCRPPGPDAGTSTEAPFPDDAPGRPSYGAVKVTVPDGMPTLPARTAACPGCGSAAPLREDGRPAAFIEDVLDAASVEGEAGAGGLRCPACGRTSPVRTWTFDPPWAFGCLGLWFWNWPPLRAEFVDALAAHLGHRVAVVSGEL